MKKLCLFLYFICSISLLQAQSIFTVLPGTDVFFSPGTIIYAGGLSVTPSAGFTINGLELNKNTTFFHYSANIAIARVYRFSGTTGNFSGNIQIDYLDAELNGLTESSLRLNIYNGAGWQAFGNNTNDGTGNSVLTTSISNVALNELTLADAAHTLPLQWGSVLAYRRDAAVTIEWNTLQEYNIVRFDVERSNGDINWTTVISNIPATNTNSTQHYQQTDREYNPQRLYYRIKETDIDGRNYYSTVVAIAAENNRNEVNLFPNPVTSVFYLTAAGPAAIKHVQLYTSTGNLVMTWTGMQPGYSIQQLPTGIYSILIKMTDGTMQYKRITRQ